MGGGHQSLPAAQIGSCLLAPGPGWATDREWRGVGHELHFISLSSLLGRLETP